MRPVKICFVALYAYHFFNQENRSRIGGAELQLYLLAVELAKDPQFDISFVVGDFGQPEFEIRQGIKLYKFFNPSKSFKYIRAVGGFIHLWSLLGKINPDIFIQRSAGLETAEIGLYCGIQGRHFIYMVAHDSDINLKKPMWHQGILGSIKWRLFRLGLHSAEMVFTQHVGQNADMARYHKIPGFVRPSAHAIPDAIDLSQKKLVLWVARCENWKWPEKYLDLAQAFPKQIFVMVMPESNDKDYFYRIASRAKTMSNLELIDFVPFNRIDDYFARSKIFVSTSKTEGFPNTFIQAAKTKTPIVSLNVNPDEMLEKNEMGICARGDFEKLKSGLEKLLADDQLRLQMGENGYKYAKENHDLKKIVEKDKELILSLVRTKS